jgi:hypothetical protein
MISPYWAGITDGSVAGMSLEEPWSLSPMENGRVRKKERTTTDKNSDLPRKYCPIALGFWMLHI